MALRDQFTDLGHEIVGNVHYRFGGFNTGLILNRRVVFRLVFVMGEYSPHLLVIPSGWKLVFARGRVFLNLNDSRLYRRPSAFIRG
jgi:hypothetical protein